jgi:hypothetical protein
LAATNINQSFGARAAAFWRRLCDLLICPAGHMKIKTEESMADTIKHLLPEPGSARFHRC